MRFNINNENIQLRLQLYLNKEDWVTALDAHDIEKVFNLTNMFDYVWLCDVLESEGEVIPSRYKKFQNIQINHITKDDFTNIFDQSNDEEGPYFNYEGKFPNRACTLKFLTAVYFTDVLDQQIYSAQIDLESLFDSSIKAFSPLYFSLDSNPIELYDNWTDLQNYPEPILSCFLHNNGTSITLSSKDVYKDVGKYYEVDEDGLIAVINEIIDIINQI